MKNFRNPKWLAFVKKCEKRVADDNKELGIKSVFLPQPQICCKPKYLIIAMEPGMETAEKMKKWIKMGYKGFVNFTIDYCAYKYLCGNKLEYQLEDYCKGAMTVKKANETKAKRYKNWLPLLKEEWELLGKPPIIAVGKGVYNTINNLARQNPSLGIKIDGYIIHYSPQAAGYRKKECESFKIKSCPLTESNKKEMMKLIDRLLKINGLKQPAISKIWGDHLYRDIGNEQLSALYGHNFEDLKSKGKIRHCKKGERHFAASHSHLNKGG